MLTHRGQILPFPLHSLFCRLELFRYVVLKGTFVHFLRTGVRHFIYKLNPFRELNHGGLLPFQEVYDPVKGELRTGLGLDIGAHPFTHERIGHRNDGHGRNLRVTGVGEGRWLVEGDVINRSPGPVSNVRVQLQTIAGSDGRPWSTEVAVTNTLPPDETAVFSREFSAAQPEGKTHPDIRAAVYWMGPPSGQAPQSPAGVAPRRPGPVPTPRV